MPRVKKQKVHSMERNRKSSKHGKRKDVHKIGSKRKLKEERETIHEMTTKRLKIDRQKDAWTEVTNRYLGRVRSDVERVHHCPRSVEVTQPKYVHVGEPLDGGLEDDCDFNEWIENNLPSHHKKSNGVHWISVVRTCMYDDAEYKTKNKPDTLGLQSAIENTEVVDQKTLKRLAKEYSFTSGKWMLYGKTGCEIDGLWRIIADGVIRGIIPSCSAKVSAVNEKKDDHIICIYNDNFFNEAEVHALRDGIMNSGIHNRLRYKADIYTHLGIKSSNEWGIDPVLYREKEKAFDNFQFDPLYDKEPSKSAVAGINITTESSPLFSISGPTRNCIIPLTLGIKSMSRLQEYGNGHDQVRLSILFHDGNTCIKGVAFGDSARKWKDNLKVPCTYTLRSYDIRYSDRKYNNTKYEIRLLENTVLTKVKHGYFQIPKENKMQISELDHQFENVLVSTSKVMFIRIGRQIRPREKFLRELYIKDSTGQIKIKMWSHERDEFPYNVGDCVKLKYAYLKYDSFCRQWFLEKNDNMMIFKCNE